jgi:hypothetical protein
MGKPQLNNKQRAWVNKFISHRPGAIVRVLGAGLAEDRLVSVEWVEFLPPIVLAGCTHHGFSWRSLSLTVKLRKFGDARAVSDFQERIVSPHCPISEPESLAMGQMLLPLPEFAAIAPAANPVATKKERSMKAKEAIAVKLQLELPLSGIAAQLHRIQVRQGKPTISTQELLSTTVEHRDLETGKDIHLPEAIVLLLQEKHATLDEWESAIALYQVAGATGALTYVEGLEDLRSHFGLNRTLATVPAPVPATETQAVRAHQLP